MHIHSIAIRRRAAAVPYLYMKPKCFYLDCGTLESIPCCSYSIGTIVGGEITDSLLYKINFVHVCITISNFFIWLLNSYKKVT